MTASSTYTYDVSPARRPSLEDLGGDDYEDDPLYAPDPTTMPNAAEHNERARNQAGLNRVCPSAIIHVTFTAGAPAIASVRGMRSSIVAGDFVLTDNAAGDTSIEWSSVLLPPSTMPPVLSLAEDVTIDRARAYLIANGVRVKTFSAATPTDCGFVVVLY